MDEPGVEDHLNSLSYPLLDVLSRHGPDMIEEIEAIASRSARFRICLGLVSSNPARPIDPAIWSRLSNAAGIGIGPVPESLQRLFGETPGLEHAITAEIPGPKDDVAGSGHELDLIARDWMIYHSTRWAPSTVDEVARRGPPSEAVSLLREIAEKADADARSWLGAGHLEDLLVYRGADVIALVEEAARESPAFREALAGVWQRNMPPDVWRRVCDACSDSAT